MKMTFTPFLYHHFFSKCPESSIKSKMCNESEPNSRTDAALMPSLVAAVPNWNFKKFGKINHVFTTEINAG